MNSHLHVTNAAVKLSGHLLLLTFLSSLCLGFNLDTRNPVVYRGGFKKDSEFGYAVAFHVPKDGAR